MIKSNFHTHSTFCDGKDSVETMVRGAIDKGLDALGISSHAMFPFASTWHLPLADYDAYTAEINRVKDAYGAQIELFTGFEADYFPVLSVPDKAHYSQFNPDYLIGSVHYLTSDTQKAAFSVDGSVEEVTNGLERCFGGNGHKAVECYFETIRTMARDCSFDVVGHADLIRIRNSALHFFDESESWYKAELARTARTFADRHLIAEINTGGLARGTIDDVYPSADFLRVLHEYEVPIVINSDAHRACDIDFAFDLAVAKAKAAGYREAYRLTRKNGKAEWIAVPFDE